MCWWSSLSQESSSARAARRFHIESPPQSRPGAAGGHRPSTATTTYQSSYGPATGKPLRSNRRQKPPAPATATAAALPAPTAHSSLANGWPASRRDIPTPLSSPSARAELPSSSALSALSGPSGGPTEEASLELFVGEGVGFAPDGPDPDPDAGPAASATGMMASSGGGGGGDGGGDASVESSRTYVGSAFARKRAPREVFRVQTHCLQAAPATADKIDSAKHNKHTASPHVFDVMELAPV